MSTPTLGRSYAALVMNQNGKVLHQVNGHKLVYPASLTKIMTLYMVFEALHQKDRHKKLRLSDRVYFSVRAAAQPPCKIQLKAGQSLTVKQAILAMVTKSANDAAVALAEKLAGSEAAFAKKMTQKARQLGLIHTTFQNASGLPHPQQKTTAHDMALLGKALIQRFPQEYRYFNTKSFVFRNVVYKNHNHLLGQVPGVDGIKTGYIEASGFNQVTSVTRKGQRFFIAVMGGKTSCWRNQHIAELIQMAYTKPEALHLITAKACAPIFADKATPELLEPQPCQASSIDALLTLSDQSNRS